MDRRGLRMEKIKMDCNYINHDVNVHVASNCHIMLCVREN